MAAPGSMFAPAYWDSGNFFIIMNKEVYCGGVSYSNSFELLNMRYVDLS